MRIIDADELINNLQRMAEESRPVAKARPMQDCTPAEYVRMKAAEELIQWLNDVPTIKPEDVRRGMCIDCIMHDESTVEAEQLRNALILMVLQYCTDDDGYLWNRCMSAGETAFKALGVKNGDSADGLWSRLDSEVE